MNGPEFTVIRGDVGSTNGGSTRCAYLTNGAILVGFMLTNGHAGGFDSSWSDICGGGVWSESTSSLVSNCVINGNYAWVTWPNNEIGNTHSIAGGAYGGTLENCVLAANGGNYGGGAAYAILKRCIVARNGAWLGGGAAECTLLNCVLMENEAWSGGGACNSSLRNCTVAANSASQGGGITSYCPYFDFGCGSPVSLAENCIVFDNTANIGANYHGDGGPVQRVVTINYSCTTPLPTNGIGNISNAPLFVDAAAGNFHLQPNSPCIDAGLNAYASGILDLDGNPRILGGTVDIGAYECHTSVRYVNVNSATPNPPYINWATAATTIQDAIDVALAGDEVLVTNGVYETGGVAVYGSETNRIAVIKPLTVRSVNGPEVTVIRGYQIPGTTNGNGAIRCVYLTNGATLAGFTLTNGATTGLYSADRYSGFGGGASCESTNAYVSNCIVSGNSAGYGGGSFSGTLNNCTLTGNTARGGGGADRSTLNNCVLAGNSADEFGGAAYFSTLNDCTLIQNSARAGGGAALSTLNGCVLTGNSAEGGGGADGCRLNRCALTANVANIGGGAALSILNNCLLNGNSAAYEGGATWSSPYCLPFDCGGCSSIGCLPRPECNPCTEFPTGSGGDRSHSVLNNCTLTGNSAQYGGGDTRSALNNCIVYDNTAANGPNYFGSYFSYSCTTPLPTNGVGNITNTPLFVDAAAGNFHLQSNSPCINAGLNAYASGILDLDGNPRIVGDVWAGTVDMGAYEFQSPRSVISYAWLIQNGLPIDGSADLADTDGDGANNFNEWNSGMSPTNSLSVLRMLTPLVSSNAVVIRWQSVRGQTYFVERSTTLWREGPYQIIATIIGEEGTTTFTDTGVVGVEVFFYRVRVIGNFHSCPNAVFGELCVFGS
jgi:hypothetical protein